MAGLVGAQSSGNRYADVGDGAFHFVPNAETAAANGFTWDDVFWYGSDEELPGSIGEPLADAAPAAAAAPELSPAAVLFPQVAASAPPAGKATSFQWDGRSWGEGDLSAFLGWLAAHGQSYVVWADSHPAAAAILQGHPDDPSREQLPKSVGGALAMAIGGGATPAEAAASVAALAASQVAQGFGAPQGPALLQAAKDVAAAYAAAGGTPSAPTGGTPASPDDGGGADRQLQGIVPADAFGNVVANLGRKRPAGVQATWRDLLDFWKLTVPAKRAAVESLGDSLKGVFGG